MGDDIHDLKGLTAFEIETRDKEVKAIAEENKKDISRLDKYVFGNGKPGIKESLEDLIEKKITHLKNNRVQAEILLNAVIEKECRDRVWFDNENKSNSEKRMDKIEERLENTATEVNKISNKIAYYTGGLAALILLLKFIHV